MQGVVPRFLDTPGEVRHAGRALGADNREIYQGLLGMSPQEFDALTAQGVI
ncbi:hypothetical protein D9M68_598360 [compost metagenome]